MTPLAFALLVSLHSAALGATPLAAHARLGYTGVRSARLRLPAAPRLVPDEGSPLVVCTLRPCGRPRSEPLRYRSRGYAYDRPEQMIADFTSRFTHDPRVTAAAIWLSTDRIRLDVRGDRFFVSVRLPTP